MEYWRCRNGSIALPELSSNWFTSPAEVTGHQKLYSVTDSETALNTRPVVSRGSVSLQEICVFYIDCSSETKLCGDNFAGVPDNVMPAWRCRNGSIALPELSSNWFTSPAEVTGHQKLYSVTDSETALNTRPVVSRGSVSLQEICVFYIDCSSETKLCGDNFAGVPDNVMPAWRCRNGSIALPELSSNWFTSPAEVTGHQKLYSVTDSETALNTRPVVSRGSVSLQEICVFYIDCSSETKLCGDNFAGVPDNVMPAWRCRNGSIALPELSSNWFTSPAEVTGHQKLYSVTDSETALNTRPVVSRGSVSLQITRN
ncbi:hypothetical protein DPMN_134890 [Dreissena polymorpha]|uniref:Uncharacterized protein n=1 Tax=Dreissena polymorpha TaxID=45954 RepID=A0A9D4G2W1_DREPO|nr:hypothetical protein DPMN_134890 [Dreissena polymorpha]